MNELTHLRQDAFAPAHTADIADCLVKSSGLRIEIDRRRGRGAGLNPSGRFEQERREAFA